MTCIVGCLSRDGQVHLGGDSAGVGGMNLHIRSDRKVFKRGPYVIGFTTSFRMGQALAYLGHLPDPAGDDPMRFMVTDFVEAVRKILKEAGFAKIENNQEEGGNFIVGWRGCLFEIYGDFQVSESAAPFVSTGCGYPFAIGAMDAMPSTRRVNNPKQFLEDALVVAQRWSAGVRAPFHFVSTEDDKP